MIYKSPIGYFEVEVVDHYLRSLTYLKKQVKFFEENKNSKLNNYIYRWLDSYFRGEANQHLPPIQVVGSQFQKRVWNIMSRIPYGRWTTYKEIAIALEYLYQKRASAQAVGQALGSNPILILLPCHRVLGQNMKLTGFREGIELKRRLLEMEGLGSDNYPVEPLKWYELLSDTKDGLRERNWYE